MSSSSLVQIYKAPFWGHAIVCYKGVVSYAFGLVIPPLECEADEAVAATAPAGEKELL
jgi:hypothetical protein